MAILDKLLPAWRHSDPEVRAAAARALSPDESAIAEALARRDADARVRREAMRKLDDPDVLAELARSESDDELRALAAGRAADLFVRRASGDNPLEACLEALAKLVRPNHCAAVATHAQHAKVRAAALARVSEEGSLAEIARRGDDPAIGVAATLRIHASALLRRVAASNAPVDVALAALERIDDPGVLQALAQDRQAQKAVRKRARALLDRVVGDDHPLRIAERHAERVELAAEVEALAETTDSDAAATALRAAQARWHELAARGAPTSEESDRFRRACDAALARIEWAARRANAEEKSERAHQNERSRREALCDEVDALAGAATQDGLAVVRAQWEAFGPITDPQDYDVAARFSAAVERCEQRYDKWRAHHEFHAKLEALVGEAERLVAAKNRDTAARRRVALEKRWSQLVASPAGAKWLADERGLERRFLDAGEALQQRTQALRERQERRAAEARAHVGDLCDRFERLLGEAVKPAALDRALAQATKAAAALKLIPGADRAALQERLEQARDALVRHASAQTQAEEWKRWANADAQRTLIERAELLLAGDDPKIMLQEIGALDREWQRCATAPRSEARKLWERFRTARNALRRRTDAYLAENLTRKTALCEAAETLGESTEWNATADAFRRLQAEWKEIGPVPARLSQALFERFRAPANAFFERRNEALSERRERSQERLAQMQAVCDAAVQLSESQEWDTAAAEIKRLQEEWRRVAPRTSPGARLVSPPLAAVAETFKTACDRFFERYRQRDAIEAHARFAALASAAEDLEALLASMGSEEPPATTAVAERLRDGLAAWARRGAIPAEVERPLATRIQAACDAIEAACGDDLEAAGLGVDTNVQQREKICTRLERLVETFAEQAERPEEMDLGARLRLAMAANTIGGSALPPREQALRETITAAERLREKWARLAPIVGARARSLEPRFAAAWHRLDGLRRAHGIGGGATL